MVDATSSAAATGASVTDKIAASRSSLASSEETFLSLLTTQLKNQDPLSPMDSNAFTQQIVQMTGVEQQLTTNDLLSMLVGMNDGGLTNSVNLIGKSVSTSSASGTLDGGKVDFSYDMSRAAASLKLEVVDSNGKTVATISPDDMSKGTKSFSWNGKSDTGNQLPDGGTYTLKATASDASGADITVTPTSLVSGIVTAVESDSGTVMLTIGNRKVPLSSVTGVSTAPATQTATQSGANTAT